MSTEPSHFPEQYPSSTFTTLFTLTDPAEAFMAGWISRLHTEKPRLFKALDLKRAERQIGGQTERLIYELAL